MRSNLETCPTDASIGTAPWQWRTGFSMLGPAFFTPLHPTPLPAPYWIARSEVLATELRLNAQWFASAEALEVFTGNRRLPGSTPLASVYSGHQFGVWAGQLGDGRALLLGETANGQEIQLKGSGPTPYSRMGDGRAVLRSSIREFLCSEAMHALGIPTTRALCLTGSDALVQRETAETAAVVTRVAPSFIRFGHFEHFAARQQISELRALADFVIDRFYSDCRQSANVYAALLDAVSKRTATLIAQWQCAGFCHGVMNTDNMSILGLTIDYGPFQFLDGFDPEHICNHSDGRGRYAYDQQPRIAHWNLFCLGQALLPLIGDPDLALAALDRFPDYFECELEIRMRTKLGLHESTAEDGALIDTLLSLLASNKADWTIFWRRLSMLVAEHGAGFPPLDAPTHPLHELLGTTITAQDWLRAYAMRLAQEPSESQATTSTRMLACNPKFILRNHLAFQVTEAARQKDFAPLHTLQRLLATPFDEHPGHEDFADFTPAWAATIENSCSS